MAAMGRAAAGVTGAALEEAAIMAVAAPLASTPRRVRLVIDAWVILHVPSLGSRVAA